jgi:hypothetical protein
MLSAGLQSLYVMNVSGRNVWLWRTYLKKPQDYASSMRGAEGIGTPPNEANYQPKGETNRPDTGRHRVRFSYYVPHS